VGCKEPLPKIVEGLRCAPFFYSALRDGDEVSHLSNCTECQADRTDEARQSLGCGWLPPSTEKTFVWHPTGLPGEPLKICAGYTAKLPQVAEAGRARLHWEKGTLAERYDGEGVTPVLMDALEIAEGAFADLIAAKSSGKGGG
jgi:hypothetical protein